jgi:hypothetical protein
MEKEEILREELKQIERHYAELVGENRILKQILEQKLEIELIPK